MYIRGCLATDCGYTESQIDELSFAFVSDLFLHWKNNPPTSWLTRWHVGYKQEDSDPADDDQLAQFSKILTPGALGPAPTQGNVPNWATDYLKKYYTEKSAHA